MNVEKEIQKKEQEYAKYLQKLQKEQEALTKLNADYMEAFAQRDTKLASCRILDSKRSVKQQVISTLIFDHQNDLLEIRHLKEVANAMARTAFLNKMKTSLTGEGVFTPPYPEVRG